MTIDLWLLTWSVVLCFAQAVIAVSGGMLKLGAATAAGNREGVAELIGWQGRARRAHLNMLENLPLFAVLVLVAHAAGEANATTALGARRSSSGRAWSMPASISPACPGCGR